MNKTDKAEKPNVTEILHNILRNAKDIKADKNASESTYDCAEAIVIEIQDLLMRSDVTILR